MREDDDRHWLSAVPAPVPPEPFTTLEVVNLQKLVREQLRRAERRAERNRETGRAKELSGADADAVRVEIFGAMDDRLEAWLQAAWPLVDAAKAEAMRGEAEAEGETVGEARWKAIRELERTLDIHIDPAQIEVQVISEGVRGTLGIGQVPARVMVRIAGAAA